MKGFISSAVILIFCLALVVAMFSFLFARADISSAVFAGPSVERARWYADLHNYASEKGISASEKDVQANLPQGTYSRQGNTITYTDLSNDLMGIHVVYKAN